MYKRVIGLTLLLLAVAGCDLFDTRTPEKPDSGRSTYIFPSTPDLAITNFINSLKEKNTQNYISCFVDTAYSAKQYHYIPTPGAATRYPAYILGWTINSEMTYLKNVFAKLSATDQLTVSLYDSTITRYANDSVQYVGRYVVQVPVKSNATQEVYSGRLLFTMVNDRRSAWVISTWEDFGADTGKTWSDMKGLNY
jgi:hypothetical protein